MQVACEKQVKAGAAAHRSEVEDAVFPLLVISQPGGSQVLDGVNLRRIHDWLIVGACHADIKGGDDLIAHAILAGHIDAGSSFRWSMVKLVILSMKIPPSQFHSSLL